eukprot:Phypoly_transcript_17072.p1 GENE.Phypoly_transcript_17072~~Phypoly_transcript_17072.p1  ORF type:complete len:150 (-),score=8.66 Phypoly_transcript_17072:290-739(-)
MTTKFVRISLSDCEHVEEAGLAEFDVEKWREERLEEERINITKTNGTILSISLSLLLLCLMVVCLVISSVYVSPLCLNEGSPKWLSLQHFLIYDSSFLAFCLFSTTGLLFTARSLYPFMNFNPGISFFIFISDIRKKQLNLPNYVAAWH